MPVLFTKTNTYTNASLLAAMSPSSANISNVLMTIFMNMAKLSCQSLALINFKKILCKLRIFWSFLALRITWRNLKLLSRDLIIQWAAFTKTGLNLTKAALFSKKKHKVNLHLNLLMELSKLSFWKKNWKIISKICDPKL